MGAVPDALADVLAGVVAAPAALAWKRRPEMRVPRRGNFSPGRKAGATPR